MKKKFEAEDFSLVKSKLVFGAGMAFLLIFSNLVIIFGRDYFSDFGGFLFVALMVFTVLLVAIAFIRLSCEFVHWLRNSVEQSKRRNLKETGC